jgi:hypothetical protein
VLLTYSGSTADATVDPTSASTLASNVIGSSGAATGSSLLAGVSAQGDSAAAAPAQPTGVTGLGRRLAQAIRSDALARARSGSALAGATFSTTTPCDSGSLNISGTVADNTGTGTVSVDYVDCRTGSDTINGPASLTIRSFDRANNIITDGTLSFTRVRFTGPGFNSDLSGTLLTQVAIGGASAATWCTSSGCGTETLTQNIIVQDNTTMRMMQAQNLRIMNAFESVTAPTFFTQSIDGRVCHDQRGCVTVTTSTAPFTAPWGPLYFATRGQSFPDWGIITLTGATGSATITSLGADLAKIQVGTSSARLRWAEFGTAFGADLADSDGDGMHNSWETAYGLNPNDRSDAATDADGDGFSNLTEYLAGSSPATNGSVPSAVRHLWVTNISDLAFDATSGQINVFVGASGSGVLLDPVTAELGATFPSTTAVPSGPGTRTVIDNGVTYTLAQTGPTTWTLTSSTGGSFTVTNVAGTDAGSLIRFGTRGLAFRTVGASSPGYIYLVESRQLIP